MRHASILVAALVAALVALTASSARADGAFLTVEDGSHTVVGKRVPLASFSAETPGAVSQSSGAGAGRVGSTTASFEIDGADDVAPYFKLATTGGERRAIVEFTTSDAQGREQVASVATFAMIAFKSCAVTLDGNGFGASYSIVSNGVTYTSPASSGAPGLQPQHILSTPIPTLRRRTAMRTLFPVLGAQVSPKVDGAFLSLQGGGTSGLPTTQVKTVAFSIEAPLNIGSQSSGAGAGKITFNPFTVTLARGGTPALQQAAQRGTAFQGGTLSFVHTSSDGKSAPVLTLDLKELAVKSDQVALAGGDLTETAVLQYGRVEFIQGN